MCNCLETVQTVFPNRISHVKVIFWLATDKRDIDIDERIIL